MAEAAYHGWRRWSHQANDALFIQCGGIDAGPEGSPMVAAAEGLCAQYEQPFELMSGDTLNRRYPHFSLPPDWRVVYQPQSGIVRPDATRSFLHNWARESGAILLHNTTVMSIDPSATGIRVSTSSQTIEADFLIVAAGSWLSHLFPELGLSLRTERRVLAWHQPLVAENLIDGRLPIFILDADGGWYGMPTPDGRIKFGHDKHLRQPIDPRLSPIAPTDEDIAKLAPCVSRYLRGFEAAPSELKSCIYTLTDDHNFIIDRHPSHSHVLLFSCCSGHGFKFAPVYGEIAADLLANKARPELDPLRLAHSGSLVTRFAE